MFDSSTDYWGNSAPADYTPRIRTETLPVRYIAISIHKSTAADMYMYDNTNQRYVFKGDNVP